MREHIDLGGPWMSVSDGAHIGESAGYASPACDTSRWKPAALPCCAEHAVAGLAYFTGPVWYRREVEVPATWSGQRIYFVCDGANYHTRLFVNGQLAGTNTTGFLRFEFDITDHLAAGKANTLSLCVDGDVKAEENPGKLIGWQHFPGVLRPLSLEMRPTSHIAVIRSTAAPTANGGRLRMEADIASAAPGDQLRLVGSSTLCTVDAQSTIEVEPQGVEPWTPESPNLYTFTLELLRAGQIIDSRDLRVGFRTITTSGEQLLLNGEPLYLCGFNRHEDSPATAMASDLRTVRQDLRRMKSAGANFVRLCHYPHDSRELDLCDELGLLAMCEVPLYWATSKDGREAECAAKFAQAREQLTSLIARDRNHPSVIFWSVSNETDDLCDLVAQGNQELVRLAKSLDPSRLAVHVSDKWTRRPSFGNDDVICINGYPNVWPFGRRPTTLADSAEVWREQIAELHAKFPGKPILVTEFGHPAIAGETAGQWGQERQAAVIAAESAGFDAPYVCGQTVWCWADHPWPPGTFMDGLGTSPFGVVTRQRESKLALSAISAAFRRRRGITRDFELPMPKGNQDVIMVSDHALPIAEPIWPKGYSIRGMKPGDESLWTDIWRDADPNLIIGDDLFTKEYGTNWDIIHQRCFLVISPSGRAIGTISAWFDANFRDAGDAGRIHWVALRREHHGKGLAQPMMSHAMQVLYRHHQRSYLVTQAFRLPAIALYCSYGFAPNIDSDQARRMWRHVASHLGESRMKRWPPAILDMIPARQDFV